MTYSFANIVHALLGHRWHYEKPGQRVCKGCHMAQVYVKGEWRSLGVIVGWRERPFKSDRLARTALFRDILKVLEGSGHEDAARKLREVFSEYA